MLVVVVCIFSLFLLVSMGGCFFWFPVPNNQESNDSHAFHSWLLEDKQKG